MKDYTIIFIGKSGSGKGTQIKQFAQYLQSKGENSIEYIESGQGLRDFIAKDMYTSKLTRHLNAEGKLYPTFIAIWSWADKIIETFSGQKFVIVDGAPRKLNEAIIIDEMFDFYQRENRYVVEINVSDEWAIERLKNRGRGDDLSDENIQTRLGWFRSNSPEILSFFKQNGKYKMITINGEQSVEDVQKDIITALEI
jgi:adenylate kinase family enzyme